MAPLTIDQLLRQYRDTITAIDAATARRLMAAHRAELQRLRGLLTGLTAALRGAPEFATPIEAAGWLRENTAAGRLLLAAERGMADFGVFAATEIDTRIDRLVQLAAEHDEKLTYASLTASSEVTPATAQAIRAAFTAIPVEAVTSAVGVLQPGSPVRALFDTFGTQASRRLGEALVGGMVRGEGAEQVARLMRASLDGDAARALTIARTEMHRAYRDASLDRYQANPRVYAGWRWHASLDGLTCPVCVAKHGSVHGADESFGSHPNCRCRPVPEVNALADVLGFTNPEVDELQSRIDAAQRVETGDAWFARQPARVQRSILGPSKHDAYTRGEITLADVVVERTDPVWGLSHRTASLRTARANAAAR